MDYVLPISRRAIFDPHLPPGSLRTLLRLAYKAWNGAQLTRHLVLSEAELIQVLGIDRATIYRHFQPLTWGRFIEWEKNRAGRYTITFLIDPTTQERAGDSNHSSTQQGPAAGATEQAGDSSTQPGNTQEGPATGATEQAGANSKDTDVLDTESSVAILRQSQKTESQFCDSPDGVVVKESIKDSDSLKQQQEQSSQFCDSRNFATEEKTAGRVERLLVAGGVWPEQAAALARRIEQHEATVAATGDLWYAETHVTTRDVLGWVMYVRDPDQVSRLRSGSGALLRANLEAGRPAEQSYRPPYVCRNCRRIAARCTCGALDPGLPDEYDQMALAEPTHRAAYEPRLSVLERWGICEICGGLPCTCQSAVAEPGAAEPDAGPGHELVTVAEPEPTVLQGLWAHVLAVAEREVQRSTFDTWLASTRLLRIESSDERHVYVVGVANAYARDWLSTKMASTLARIVAPAVSRPVEVRFEVIE